MCPWYRSSIFLMSYWGLELPNRLPMTSFWNRVRSAPESWTVSLVGSASPVMTTRPPLRMASTDSWTTCSSTMSTVTMALSAPTPRVSSPTSALASSPEATLWVAPNSSAFSRLLASGSTATMLAAPA